MYRVGNKFRNGIAILTITGIKGEYYEVNWTNTKSGGLLTEGDITQFLRKGVLVKINTFKEYLTEAELC